MPYSLKNNISTLFTGLSPCNVCRSRQLQLVDLAIYLHHISYHLSTADSVCPLPFSLAANKGIIIYFLLLRVLRCFNSPRAFFSRSNSEILGSKLACSSPKLIAACHVLHQYQNQAIRLTAFVECFF